jgi:uncharacterized membrane protein YfcA
MLQTSILCFFAFLAGLIDSIAGGGGLIQLPALLIAFPSLPVATILGTNKMISMTGTGVATYRYARNIPMKWRVLIPASVVAFLFSFLGAHVVSGIRTEFIRPFIIVLLISIALFVFLKKDFGKYNKSTLSSTRQFWLGLITSMAIGFYDGFFGPGTGSFIIIAFIAIFAFDFLTASASSKVINLATNFAAFLYFSSNGHILFNIAIPMALSNILGAIAGTHLAILKGSRFVRILFLIAVIGVIIKLIYDTLLIKLV